MPNGPGGPYPWWAGAWAASTPGRWPAAIPGRSGRSSPWAAPTPCMTRGRTTPTVLTSASVSCTPPAASCPAASSGPGPSTCRRRRSTPAGTASCPGGRASSRRRRCTQNVEVRCSHVGFGVDPATLWLIADRLAVPAGQRVPFRPPLALRPLYPRPQMTGPAMAPRTATRPAPWAFAAPWGARGYVTDLDGPVHWVEFGAGPAARPGRAADRVRARPGRLAPELVPDRTRAGRQPPRGRAGPARVRPDPGHPRHVDRPAQRQAPRPVRPGGHRHAGDPGRELHGRADLHPADGRRAGHRPGPRADRSRAAAAPAGPRPAGGQPVPAVRAARPRRALRQDGHGPHAAATGRPARHRPLLRRPVPGRPGHAHRVDRAGRRAPEPAEHEPGTRPSWPRPGR